MRGRHRLRAGAPRLLGRHDGQRGRWYGEAWRALLAELGPLAGLARLEAGRTAVAWVNYRAATAALEDARRTRETGRGRRPSPRLLERLQRRQALQDGTYSQAVDRLRDLVKVNGHTDALAAALRESS